MMSPTHTIMALAILGRTGKPKRNWAAFIGSIIPDAFIYICASWLIGIKGVTHQQMWNEIYFDPPMQLTASVFNSIPLYIVLAGIGWSFRAKLWARIIMFFALAALIHIAFDFPVHNDDAYAHFWPLSDWRFISPVSYWDKDHHAGIISIIESLIAFATVAILWNRFPKTWVRILLLILSMFYGAIILSRF